MISSRDLMYRRKKKRAQILPPSKQFIAKLLIAHTSIAAQNA